MKHILGFGDRAYILTGFFCDNDRECSSILEVDLEGNVLREISMDFLDAGKDMLLSGDTLIVVGNSNTVAYEWLLHKRTIYGDSIETITLTCPDTAANNLFAINLDKYNGNYVLSGVGRDTNRLNMIYQLDTNGVIDTFFISERARNTFIRTVPSRNPEFFNTFSYRDNGEFLIDPFIYRRYDRDWNVVWSYEMDSVQISQLTTAVEIEDKGLVFTFRSFFEISQHTRGIDSLGKTLWETSFASDDIEAVDIDHMINTSDGNILGIGRAFYNNMDSLEYDVNWVPYVVKFTESGEKLWEKGFIQRDSLFPTRAIYGRFSAVEELDDGSFLLGGIYGSPYLLKMLVRISGDGCIGENCGEGFFTSVDMPKQYIDAAIYPNPITGDILHISSLEDLEGKITGQIFNVQGETVTSEIPVINRQVDISKLPEGVYILQILHKERRATSFKFIKTK